MSTSHKPRGTASGQPVTELDKLKDVWRRMRDEPRAYWLEQFDSQRTQADLRKEIQARFKVNLARDNQLTRFRAFVARQIALDTQAERIEENRNRIRREHPGWTKDDVLAEVIKCGGEEALASGDYKLGLKTVSVDTKRQALDFDRQKFEFDAAQAALQAVMELKTISASKLSDVEKIDAARRALFGTLPASQTEEPA